MQNALTEQWAGASPEMLHAHKEELQATLTLARQSSDHRQAPIIAGEAADLVRHVLPAEVIVKVTEPKPSVAGMKRRGRSACLNRLSAIG